MTTDSEHLQWIHDRLVHVHGENENYDYMHRLRKVIEAQRKREQVEAAMMRRLAEEEL